MAWATFTTAQMDAIGRQLLMPLVLLINYSLLQYLLVVYYARHREWRVRLLFAVAALGVACLVPFAHPDDATVGHLNDVSESCCVLTFLIQITIVGHDLNKKIKFRTVMVLTCIAELLVAADLVMVLLSLVFFVKRDLLTQYVQDELPNLGENVTLAYIFVFRFYYVVASRGWQDLYRNRKLELGWYLLFATHEVPFVLLESASGLSWEFAQSLNNRITLAGCLFVTARSKLRAKRSAHSRDSATRATSTATPSGVVAPKGSTRLSETRAKVRAVSSAHHLSSTSRKPSGSAAASITAATDKDQQHE